MTPSLSKFSGKRPPARRAAALRVLLAEDNPVNRTLMINLLAKRGYHVTIAENGREAADAHATESFDVVLMDVQMPEMDGLEATAVIRERERARGERIPIVGLTAHAVKADKERCLAAGMDEYLTKPVRSLTLFQTLERVASKPSKAVDAPLAFDTREALSRVGEDRDLLAKNVRLFRSDSPRLMAAIRDAVTARDSEALVRAAHELKGSVGIFGATSTIACALELERLGREANFKEAGPKYEELEGHLEILERDLSAFVAQP